MEEVLHIKTSQKCMRKSPSYRFKNINLHVDKGEFVAIMGPSGSGKSTFLNVISTIDSLLLVMSLLTEKTHIS